MARDREANETTLDRILEPDRVELREATHRFSGLLFRAVRSKADLAQAVEAADRLGRLAERQARVEEEVLFPELSGLLGGPGGPVERARAERRRLARSARLFREAARRFEAEFPSPEDARLMGQRGHELLRVLAEKLGAVDGYLLRVADGALRGPARLALLDRLQAALSKRDDGRH